MLSGGEQHNREIEECYREVNSTTERFKCYREVNSTTERFKPQTVMVWNEEGEIISSKKKVM
jgi:hypothetical protein